MQVAVPFAGAVQVKTASGSPSGSVSFASTGTDTALPAVVAAESSAASGGSLDGVTVTVTWAVSHSDGTPPSQTVYVKLSVPLKFANGVYVTVPPALTTAVPLVGADSEPGTTVSDWLHSFAGPGLSFGRTS